MVHMTVSQQFSGGGTNSCTKLVYASVNIAHQLAKTKTKTMDSFHPRDRTLGGWLVELLDRSPRVLRCANCAPPPPVAP